jgi:hypothetical protein
MVGKTHNADHFAWDLDEWKEIWWIRPGILRSEETIEESVYGSERRDEMSGRRRIM